MATPPFKFGNTHLEFNPEDVEKLHKAWEVIDHDDLAREGLETDTHLTVRYGLNDVNFTQLYNAVSEKLEPLPITVYDVGLFETEDGDCIHWQAVPTAPLLELRKLVEDIADREAPTFPDYKPHITIAYVKEGKGQEYLEKIREHLGIREKWLLRVTADTFVYVAKDGKRHVVPLVSRKQIAEENIHNLLTKVLRK